MKDLQVILDTNFLMIPERHGVDIFSELNRILDKKHELIVPKVVIDELKHLKKEGTPSEKKAAKIALQLADRAKKVKSEKSADEEIIRLAKKGNRAVGTNDKNLKKRLQKEGIPVIYLRQKSHLEISSMV